jgi:hypothetical protein
MSESSSARGAGFKELARRMARPLTGPVDGRVADINRRLGDTRSTVERRAEALEHAVAHGRHALASYADAVAAYARAATETTGFLGVELRRLDEAVRASVQSAAAAAESSERAAQASEAARSAAVATGEESYRDRLGQAAELPLADLEAPLAAVINRESGPLGFAAQGDLWFMSPVWVEVGPGEAHLRRVNERILEVPFAMAALWHVDPAARILDIGSSESTFALSAASLGYRVTAVDPRPVRYAHPNLTTFHGRFEEWEPTAAADYDAIFLISTVEHVGIGAYGQESYGGETVGGGADRAMIERVLGLLKPRGILVLTTPTGTRGTDALERTYDDEALSALLAGFEVLERRDGLRVDELTWVSGVAPGPGERGVAMIIATPEAG